jgi:hypothetical protein
MVCKSKGCSRSGSPSQCSYLVQSQCNGIPAATRARQSELFGYYRAPLGETNRRRVDEVSSSRQHAHLLVQIYEGKENNANGNSPSPGLRQLQQWLLKWYGSEVVPEDRQRVGSVAVPGLQQVVRQPTAHHRNRAD